MSELMNILCQFCFGSIFFLIVIAIFGAVVFVIYQTVGLLAATLFFLVVAVPLFIKTEAPL